MTKFFRVSQSLWIAPGTAGFPITLPPGMWQVTATSASDSKWGQPHAVPYGTSASWNIGDEPKPTVPSWWAPHCDHVFVDTGTLKSYCKKCDADAVWCNKELKFVLK